MFDGKINMGFSCEVPAAHSFNKAAVHNDPVECKILRVIVLIFEQFFLVFRFFIFLEMNYISI